jgi:hypothetical protein
MTREIGRLAHGRRTGFQRNAPGAGTPAPPDR